MNIELTNKEAEIVRDFLGSLNYKTIKMFCERGIRELDPKQAGGCLSVLYHKLDQKVKQ